MSEAQVTSIDGTRQSLVPRPPLLSSQELDWEGVCIQYHRQPVWETPYAHGPHHSIVVHHSKFQTERLLDGRRQQEQAVKGDIAIIPESTPNYHCWDREVEFSLLFLEPTHIAQIAYESIDGDRAEIL